VAHIQKHHRGQDIKPRPVYNTGLVLDIIFKDGEPVEKAEKYALDFVYEMAEQLGKLDEWKDLCGRNKTGPCRCTEGSSDS
jgi:hypothetical protein